MGVIVVGVDGSPGSKAALAWALAEARLRGSTVRAVHAWTLPLLPAATLGFAPAVVHSAEEAREFEQAGRRLLDEAVAEATRDGAEGVDIERKLVQERAAQALLDEAADAELLVVGSRGLGGFAELLIGSVSHQCANHASCPVVIVRKPTD